MQPSRPRSPARSAVALVLALALAAAAGGCASTISQPTAAAAGSPSVAEPLPRPSIFHFHDPVGMNLHHFLYWTALPHRRETGGQPFLEWPESLGAAERTTVDRAVAVYRQRFHDQDLLFGQELYRIKIELARHDGGDTFDELDIPPDVAATLEATLPIYRRHLWPAHHAANRAWIEDAAAGVARHGERIVELLEQALEDPFPPTPIRVDVVVEGHWAGAYTTDDPMHVVIHGTRPGYQGLAAVEMLFHESSHGMLSPRRGTVIDAVDAELAAIGGDRPRGFWHALLFYTAGWAAKQAFAEAGEEGYVPFARAHGLYEGPWGAFLPILESRWQRHLDGETSLGESAAAMAGDLAALPAE